MATVNLETLGRNSLVAGLAEIWRIVSRFILTPLIIAQIGMEGYGTWSLVFSLTAYVSMANVSFGAAYTKFTAECVRREQYDRLAQILGSGMTGIGAIALIGVCISWLWGEPVLASLGVPAEMVPDANVALLIIVSCLVLRMTLGCTLEVLSGIQRIDLTYRLAILASIVEFCVSLPLLLHGWGIVGLAIGHGIGQVLTDLIAYLLVRRHLPQLRLSPFLSSREGVRLLLSVGGRFQVLSLVNTIVMQGAKFVLSAFLGVRWVGIFELALKLVTLGKSVCASIVAPLMPAFAHLQAGKETEEEQRLVLRGSKALALVGSTSFGFLGAFAGPILLMWTAEKMPESALALQLMAFGEVTNLLTGIASANLRARGQIGLEFKFAVVSISIFTIVIYPLASAFGFYGLVGARVTAQVLAGGWYLRAFLKASNLDVTAYLSGAGVVRTALVIGVVLVVVSTAYTLLPALSVSTLSVRWAAVVELSLWASLYFPLTLVMSWRVVLDADERESIRAVFRRRLGRFVRKVG